MEKLKIGILGTANIAVRSIIPSIKTLKNKYELYGIANRDKSKAEKIANVFDTKAFKNYSAILDTEILDAIYIPLPNSMHYEWVNYALERNIHVLVEKSLTCSYKNTLELCKKAEVKVLCSLKIFNSGFIVN